MFILIHIDDFIIIGSFVFEVSSLISLLNKHFALKDIGPFLFHKHHESSSFTNKVYQRTSTSNTYVRS